MGLCSPGGKGWPSAVSACSFIFLSLFELLLQIFKPFKAFKAAEEPLQAGVAMHFCHLRKKI